MIHRPKNRRPPDEIIEIVSVWNDTVLDVVHLPITGADPAPFTVGEAFGCRFPVPMELLGGESSAPLIERVDGGVAVSVPPGATGELTFEDGRRATFTELVGCGAARRGARHSGSLTLDLPRRGRSRIDIGPFTFLVNSVGPPRLALPRATADRKTWAFAGFSALLHVVFLGLLALAPPAAHGLSLDQLETSSRFFRYMIAPPEVRVEALPEILEKKPEPEEAPDSGRAHAGPDGQMGDRQAPRRNTAYRIKGPPDNRQIRLARDTARELASRAGILSHLSASRVPPSPFGADFARGIDPENALGHLVGDGFGDAFGYGGLGIRGTGRGGGGDAGGTIGVGSIFDTITGGRGPRRGRGPGDGSGPALGPRDPGHRPAPIGGVAKVTGTIPREAIRRVVQRHINEIKFCYDRALASRPDLEGRIAVRFVISPRGAVQAVMIENSSVNSAAMEQCVAGAVRRWTFPQPPDGGVVIVSYPFAFTSADR